MIGCRRPARSREGVVVRLLLGALARSATHRARRHRPRQLHAARAGRRRISLDGTAVMAEILPNHSVASLWRCRGQVPLIARQESNRAGREPGRGCHTTAKKLSRCSSSVAGTLPGMSRQARPERGDRHDRLQAAGGSAAGRDGVRPRTQFAAEVIRPSGVMLDVSAAVRMSSPAVATVLLAARRCVSANLPAARVLPRIAPTRLGHLAWTRPTGRARCARRERSGRGALCAAGARRSAARRCAGSTAAGWRPR